jgi:hypothetical protein
LLFGFVCCSSSWVRGSNLQSGFGLAAEAHQ